MGGVTNEYYNNDVAIYERFQSWSFRSLTRMAPKSDTTRFLFCS